MAKKDRAAEREARARQKERERAAKAERAMRGKSLAARIQANERETARRAESARAARRRARTVQDAIGFEKIYSDGVAMVEEGLWSMTALVPDINYRSARDDERKSIWGVLCDVYNSLSPDISIQLTMLNSVDDAESRYEDIKLPYTERSDEDELVDEYNEMLKTQVTRTGHVAIRRSTYVTISMAAPDHDTAASSLHSVMTPIVSSMERIGSHARVLGGDEYLELVGQILRPGEVANYDLADLEAAGVDVKDAVSPLDLDFLPDGSSGKNDCWRSGSEPQKLADGTVSSDTWFQALMFREPFPTIVPDSALTDLLSLPIPMCLTMHLHPVEPTKAIDQVQKKLSFMKSEQAHQGKKAAAAGLDPVLSQSITLTQNLTEGEDMLSALSDRDERMFSVYIQVCTWSRTRTQMEDNAFAIAQQASKRLFKLGVPRWQLRDCMNSMLPFANDYMRSHRYLLTTEVATLQPFVTQEISERGGIYIGTNKLSGNMIIAARRRLTAPMGWIMAEPGYGKSFAAKQEIFANAIANPTDTIWIIDPAGEYVYITEQLGGQSIDLAADSKDHINLFDLDTSYLAGGDPMTFKCEFVASTISTLLGTDSLSARAKSCIDTMVIESYRELGTSKGGQMPTLTYFWYKLRNSNDPVAQDLSYQLERFVKGSLRAFAYPTNVDLSARIVDINMKSLSGDLRLFGQLVSLDAAWNRVRQNQDKAHRTWIYIDEAHNFFKSEPALDYFTKFWSEGRKYGLIPTGITQNIDRVMNHYEARQMLSNSDFILMLQQSPNDLRCVRELYNLSAEQAENLRTNTPGEGLLLYGGKVVPFQNQFPKNTRLYELFDTDPNTAEDKRRAAGRI